MQVRMRTPSRSQQSGLAAAHVEKFHCNQEPLVAGSPASRERQDYESTQASRYDARFITYRLRTRYVPLRQDWMTRPRTSGHGLVLHPRLWEAVWISGYGTSSVDIEVKTARYPAFDNTCRIFRRRDQREESVSIRRPVNSTSKSVDLIVASTTRDPSC